MYDYIARAPFKLNTPQGEKVVSKGEALCLSSLKAAPAVRQGVLLERNVSGLQDILSTCESRTRILVDKLQIPAGQANKQSIGLAVSLMVRHESLKSFRPPTQEFLKEVIEFNRTSPGNSPVTEIKSDKGAGEWAGYNCNIGTGCAHGCLYCYAQKLAYRFNRVKDLETWREEVMREVSTAKCKKYPKPIMFPTTHDVTPAYLPAYRRHLYNLLNAGNTVVAVSKPHRASIEAICSEFSSFRDNLILRFSIGGLDNDALQLWEPGAPSLSERLWCLRYAFEQGFKTSISSEPMLVNCDEAERFYYTVQPLVTEDIWFGKMNNVGGFRNHSDSEVARRAKELLEAHSNGNILQFVRRLDGLPKVMWKDSIKEIVEKHGGRSVS